MAKLGLVAAMEQEAEIEKAAQDKEIEIVPAADSLETKMLEVQEAVKEIEGRVDAIEEAVEDVNTLEKVEDQVEKEMEEGGMSESTAEMAEIAIESIHRRLGIERIARPSMESFGNTATRMDATKITLESIKDSVKRVWQVIVDAIKRVITWIGEFTKSVLNANEKMMKRASEIDKLTHSIKRDDVPENESIKVRGVIDNLYYTNTRSESGGDFNSRTIVAGIKQMTITTSTLEYFTKRILENVEKYTSYTEEERHMDEPDARRNLPGLSYLLDENHFDVELPGNRKIVIGSRVLKIFGKEIKFPSNVTVEPWNPKRKRFDNYELPTMTQPEIEFVVDRVMGLGREIERIKDQNNKITSGMKKLTGNLDRMLKYDQGQEYTQHRRDERDQAWSDTKGVISAVANLLPKLVSTVARISLSIGKSALDYCEASLRQYK